MGLFLFSSFALGLSSLDPSPALVALAKEAGAKFYLVALPWKLLEPQAWEGEISLEGAKGDKGLLEKYSQSLKWEAADALISALKEAGIEPVIGVGWGWSRFVPRYKEGPLSPDFVGQEAYLARFLLHLRAVVERYDGDGFLDAPGGLKVHRWAPERALNEAVVEAALGKRELSLFSAVYSTWSYWGFLDRMVREAFQAVKSANSEAEVFLILQTDVPEMVSTYLGKPSWEGALSAWSNWADAVVLETFPNAWLPEPLRVDIVEAKVQRARKLLDGKLLLVQTGYPSGPPQMGYDEEKQALFLRRAVEALEKAGADGMLWFTLRTSEALPVEPSPQDVQDLEAIGKALEGGDVSYIVNLAMSDPARAERLLKIASSAEEFMGLVRPDGRKKPAWQEFFKLATPPQK